jgi:hypothetical protein
MGEGSDLNVADRRRPWRESDGVVGASRPGIQCRSLFRGVGRPEAKNC